ncbi:hypothetical protein HUJ04_007273, partial [Dendroctonus ponderosae]
MLKASAVVSVLNIQDGAFNWNKFVSWQMKFPGILVAISLNLNNKSRWSEQRTHITCNLLQQHADACSYLDDQNMVLDSNLLILFEEKNHQSFNDLANRMLKKYNSVPVCVIENKHLFYSITRHKADRN